MLYANSCAAVNLCHRLLEESWDGGWAALSTLVLGGGFLFDNKLEIM
jgi:hypothetical protein